MMTASEAPLPTPLGFLAGGGEATKLILKRDWSGHWLGEPAGWPEGLKVTLATVLNSPESMILCWGRDELTFFFNETYFPLLGPRLSWAMGSPFSEVWSDAWEQARPIIDEAFAGRSQRFNDLPWKLDTDRGAADTWFTFSYSRILDANGESAGLFIFTNETTARVIADKALARSQDELRAANASLEDRVRAATAEVLLYREIVRSNARPVMAFDRDLLITAFNQAHVDKFLQTQGVVSEIGHRFPDHFIPEEREAITGLMRRALAGETFTTRVHFGDPNFDRIHWDITFTPLRDEAGEVIGGFHQAHDVTLQVEAEEALAQSREALRQAQKMEAVGQLTGGLAHDFNNLLTGMMGNLELLQHRISRGRVDDLDRFIVAALGAGERAASLTQRLLAFSRRQTLDPRSTDINALITGMEDMIRRSVGPANELIIHGADDLWSTHIDGGQLENALLNLCINARDAMPDGGRIVVETGNVPLDYRSAAENDLSPGDYVAISVTDTGTGMSPETIERAFEPFFTTKPLGEGTGLGLSMIYGFARQSGGHVRVDSKLGSGTTMRVYLPRHLGVASGQEMKADTSLCATGEVAGTVLVVDDETTVRDLVAELLKDQGYTVLMASDGAAGLKILQSGTAVDLLVTDVGLPNGMNGRQVADAARTLVPGLKTLFITGYAENAVVGNGNLEPGMEVLTKPFSLDALYAKVSAMMLPAGG